MCWRAEAKDPGIRDLGQSAGSYLGSLAMKWLLPVLVVAWIIAEVATLVVNPFHAPASQLPMRLFGMQYFKAQDDTMAPTLAQTITS